MLEVDWPRHSSKNFYCENCFTLDAWRETHEGPSQDHVVTDSGKRNQGDGKDLGTHQAHGKGSADVEGVRCCPTYHLGVKGMSEWVSRLGSTKTRRFHLLTLELRFLKKLHQTPFYVNQQLFCHNFCSEATGKGEFFRDENRTLNYVRAVNE